MIKELAKSIRQYKKASILTPIFVMLEVVMEVSIPITMAKLIDFGIDKGDMSYILKTGAFLLLLAGIALYLGIMAGKTAATASCGFAANLRQDVFYRIQNFSFSNIDKFSTSSLITRLTTDITNIQNSYQMLIRLTARSPLVLIFSLIVCFSIDKKLSLIFLTMLPVLGTGLYLIIRFAHPKFVKVFKIYDRLNQVVQENLRGIRVVKAFAREEYEKEKFSGISKEIYKLFSAAEKIISFNAPLMQFCTYSCMLLISWFGARAIVASGYNASLGLTTGELISLFSYTLSILMSLMMLSIVFVTITISRASAERVVEVLKEESDIKNPPTPVTEVANGEIIFKNVNFSYTKNFEKLVLSNINFTIASGETVGILGGTGSSKSTLVQLIPRLYDVLEGEVLIGGVNVKEYDLTVLRDSVAMVLQKNLLFSGTIAENLRWGNEEATMDELIHACKLAHADEFISSFPKGYDTYIEQEGSNVSGGQKQRLCIARALLKKPKILILDDSTSAVDTATDAQIRKAFREEIPQTTKIIIAQRVASIENADKIIVMDDGLIVDLGTHQELLDHCLIYQEVYESQMKGGVSQ